MIFKLHILSGRSTIKKIIVFGLSEFVIDKKQTNKNPIDKTTNSPIFDEEELNIITTQNIPVEFYPMLLHYDDTIETIKIKIRMATNITEPLFLYGRIKEETSDIMIPIGQKIISKNVYSVNPFIFLDENENENENIDTSLSVKINSESLLFEYGFFYKNVIHLCFLSDVLASIKEGGEFENKSNKIKQIYFKDQSHLNVNSQEIPLQNYKSVDLLTDVYLYRKSDLPYTYTGIKSIQFSFQLKKGSIPLEIIFKKISSSLTIPLIKYNPGSRKENIYRLFCKTKTSNGSKIPILSKAIIFRLVRSIGNIKSIAFFVYHKQKEFVVEVYETGLILISLNKMGAPTDFTSLAIDELNILLLQCVNPIIEKIQEIINNSFSSPSNTLQLFTSITDNKMKIIKMDYEMKLPITHKVNVLRYIKCLRNVFIFEKENQLRYTRVSNFNKNNSIEIFVMDSIKNKMNIRDIIISLVENYSLTQNDALQLLTSITNEIQLELNVRKRLIEIKENSGFPVYLFLDTRAETLTITISNIDNIFYITTIPIFIDSLLRLSIDPKSTSISKTNIDKLCLDKSKTARNQETIREEGPGNKKDPTKQLRKTIIDIENRITHTNKSNQNDFLEEEEAEEVEEVNEENIEELLDDTNKENIGEEESEAEEGEESEGEESDNNEIVNFLYSMDDDSDDDTTIHNKGGASKEDDFMSSVYEENEDNEDNENHEEDENDIHADIDEEMGNEKIKNIVGMKLHNPYYFKNRLEKLAPYIFTKDKNNDMNNYSRLCQSSTKRQPVVITQRELDEINQRNPGYLKPEDVLKYGSTKENTNYFICPRYWCLLNDKMMTKEEVERGECGGKVLSMTDNEVKKDHYIYEFAGKDHYPNGKPDKTRDTYIKHYPGFSSKKFSDGTCVPCCFKNWNTPSILKRKKECKAAQSVRDSVVENESNVQTSKLESNVQTPDNESNVQSPDNESNVQSPDNESNVQSPDNEGENITPTINTKLIYDYIYGPEKFPIPAQRFGYLPVILQKFFNDFHINCQVSSMDTRIKSNYNCLVRHGVEYSDKQSFVACMADVYSYISLPNILSIKDFKDVIISSLSLDEFITYQNGNLVTQFQPFINVGETIDDVYPYEDNEIPALIEKYKGNDIFLRTSTNIKYLKNLILAYENFIQYLKDDNVTIDHSYLWDIVSKPNTKLFDQGLNLLILSIPDDDNTNNIELVCPKNHYSGVFYESRKPYLILIQQGNYFEPIYSYKNIGKKTLRIKIKKTFTDYDAYINPPIKNFIQKVVKPIFENQSLCFPQKSMPNKYKFKQPILLTNLIYELLLKNYEITNQVINFQSKVIGLIVKKNQRGCFVPCYPSSIDSKYSFIYVTDVEWYPYKQTVDFLKNLHEITNGNVPCNPLFKVTETEHIVGILTETDQFIEIQPFLFINDIDASDNLHVLNETNYLLAEESMAFTRKEDEERVVYINRLKKEYKSYNDFRNMVRNLLHKAENISIKTNIDDEIKKKFVLFSVKQNKIVSLIESLLTSNQNENKEYSYHLADEMIRYTRIYMYMFYPNVNLAFGDDNYIVLENELLILQSNLLEDNYLENLIPSDENKYTNYTSYDTVEPKITQPYSNEVTLTQPTINENCEIDILPISSVFWKKMFQTNTREVRYNNNIVCGYLYIIHIIQKTRGVTFTISEIKTLLVKEYNTYYSLYGIKILDILRFQGKNIIQQVKSNITNLSFFILSDDYYITLLDIYILFQYLKIPTFVISNKPIMETRYSSNIICLYKELNDISKEDFVVLFSQPVSKKIPRYIHLTSQDTSSLLFNSLSFSKKLLDIFIQSYKDYVSVENFLEQHQVEKTTKYIKKKQMGGGNLYENPMITI
jgi:hypothetical protein